MSCKYILDYLRTTLRLKAEVLRTHFNKIKTETATHIDTFEIKLKTLQRTVTVAINIKFGLLANIAYYKFNVNTYGPF